ncbi:hypothetical protein CAXC1_150058 [Candidatus Xenohaliotis californiensis]|uniref:Uncharacterized protein n=1 Tax=Candidatus Xenohaliotis californiensis TaxID=84677 RepID=A0ABP0ERW4_9RICK|nr:hypothetical protein CAXC1_150058 [Candidatus Xenohaliotis californiensis]
MPESDSSMSVDRADNIVTEANGFILGDTLDDRVSLISVLQRLIQPEAYVFKDPPRKVVNGEIVGLKDCESYRNSSGKFMFRLPPSEMHDVLPEDAKAGHKVAGSESGISIESEDGGELDIKIKKPDTTLWQRIRGFGLLDINHAFTNATDVRKRWIKSLSEIATKSIDGNGNSVFNFSDKSLESMSPTDRAYLLKSLSDDKDISKHIASISSINAYSPNKSVLKNGIKDIAKIIPVGLDIVFLAPVRFVANCIKGLPFPKKAFVNLAKDMFGVVKCVTGLNGVIDRVKTLTGKERTLYILSKIATAPIHLVGGAFADHKIYSALLERKCKSDLKDIEKDFKKVKDEYQSSIKDKEQSKDKVDEKVKSSKKEHVNSKTNKEDVGMKGKELSYRSKSSGIRDMVNLHGGGYRMGDSSTHITKMNNGSIPSKDTRSVTGAAHSSGSITTIKPYHRDELTSKGIDSLQNAANVLSKSHFTEADGGIDGSNIHGQTKQIASQNKFVR